MWNACTRLDISFIGKYYLINLVCIWLLRLNVFCILLAIYVYYFLNCRDIVFAHFCNQAALFSFWLLRTTYILTLSFCHLYCMFSPIFNLFFIIYFYLINGSKLTINWKRRIFLFTQPELTTAICFSICSQKALSKSLNCFKVHSKNKVISSRIMKSMDRPTFILSLKDHWIMAKAVTKDKTEGCTWRLIRF